jgi:hypothetical protein
MPNADAPAGSAYPWYRLVSGDEIEQGDLLLNCPVFVIPPGAFSDPAQRQITIERQDVIVMTQSCDLALRANGHCAVEDVILSPIYARAALGPHKTYGKPQGWEEARRGRHAGYHVLNHCQLAGHQMDYCLVDLRRIFTLSVELVRVIAGAQGQRLRLLPPYREHLSQAFARFFMRVGLPVDVAPFR